MLAVLTSCSKINGDINQVANPYFDKAYFNSAWNKRSLSPEEWHYRMTVVATPPNVQSVSVGDGHWMQLEKIRWEIGENYLVGYRSYAAVKGAENEIAGTGNLSYRGQPVVAFKISGHFDINRKLDPMTKERSNIISENADRPWNERRFFRVDFGRNVIGQLTRNDGSGNLENDTQHLIENNNPADPNRFRFDRAYFDITTRQAVGSDFWTAIGGMGPAFGGDTAAPVIDVRHSFKMANPNNDYEPLNYPDSVAIVDASGREVRGKDGMTKRLPIWEKFGFYRSSFSGRQTWDDKRGSLESKKNFNITRFNIWKASRYADGKAIPMELRDTKPIVYWTNVHHPNNLLGASKRVAAEWNGVFKEAVFYAQPGRYASIESVPDMVLLNENACNIDNVIAAVSQQSSDIQKKVLSGARASLAEIKTHISQANADDNPASFTERHAQEVRAKTELERICSALEYHTAGSKRRFVYQRPGDIRFNLMNLIVDRAPTPWSGLGPMFADPVTGETIQATANVNLWYIDKRAAQANEQIEMLNSDAIVHDLVFGKEVREAYQQTTARLAFESSRFPSDKAIAKMNRRFNEFEKSGQLLKEISPDFERGRLALAAKSGVDRLFFKAKDHEGYERASDTLRDLMFLNGTIKQSNLKDVMAFSDDILDTVSPARGKDFLSRIHAHEEGHFHAAESLRDPPEFLDRMLLGIAMQYKNLSKNQRFLKIRDAIYTATMLHEMGHNMGLAHNMQGSADALNYGRRFWELQALPADLAAALNATTDEPTRKALSTCIAEYDGLRNLAATLNHHFELTAQDCLRQQEGMYSSIMDYHAMWNSDINGLGPHDRAAIKFGYTQNVEVFKPELVKIDLNKTSMKRWLFLNDWKKIPTELLASADAIHNRDHVKYTWGDATTQFVPPPHEVPYKYCIDSTGTYDATCAAFDFGPDMKTQAQWLGTQYWQQYYMTHFSRDRVLSFNYDLNHIIDGDLSIMRRYNNIMNWYYYYKATDKEFTGSDAERDFLSAVTSGLNHFSHVLGHPLPGPYVNAPAYKVEQISPHATVANRLAPTNMLIPFGSLDNCDAMNAAKLEEDGRPSGALKGYSMVKIPLGEGRPFGVGFTNDYETWYITYVGSLFTKLYALRYLTAPGAFYPRTDMMKDPRFYSVSWYRLFPDEVGKLIHDLITENLVELGPVIDHDGTYKHRDLLDPETLSTPDYRNTLSIMPSMSSLIPYQAMLWSGFMLSGNDHGQLDMSEAMRIMVAGGSDNVDVPNKTTQTFEHPITHTIYRAARVNKNPIAFDLVTQANILKTKYLTLDRCVKNVGERKDPACQCIKKKQDGTCCHQNNPDCNAISLEPIGQGACLESVLLERRDRAKEQMEEKVGMMDDMRWLVHTMKNAA
jgi:hypothetical protein